ncbi:hypothetical protein QVD17_12611 [Tagetes erecta]|uniref:Uncharacterized protein n=1 Tax=Tagetes erecta TaxID=13708 RepID=A0AAD8KZQ0_TARER|nr:hypothetical protein QVD17_12611 [Tagetes erecta]
MMWFMGYSNTQNIISEWKHKYLPLMWGKARVHNPTARKQSSLLEHSKSNKGEKTGSTRKQKNQEINKPEDIEAQQYVFKGQKRDEEGYDMKQKFSQHDQGMSDTLFDGSDGKGCNNDDKDDNDDDNENREHDHTCNFDVGKKD